MSSHQCLETCDLIIAVGPVQGSQYLPSKSFENLHALAKSLGIPSQRWQAASENLGENGRAGRRLGVILLYKLVIGMLRTNAEFIEMLTGFAFWQDLKTPCLSNSTTCSEAFPHLKLCPWKARNERTGGVSQGNSWQHPGCGPNSCQLTIMKCWSQFALCQRSRPYVSSLNLGIVSTTSHLWHIGERWLKWAPPLPANPFAVACGLRDTN